MKSRIRSYEKIGKNTFLTNTYDSLTEYIIIMFFKILFIAPFYLLYLMFKYMFVGIGKLIEYIKNKRNKNDL